MYKLEMEVFSAAMVLMRDMFKIKEGETIVITADTSSNENIVRASASAAKACGAKPMVIWLATPDGVGKDTDAKVPVEALTGALLNTDCWVEFNKGWLLYSTPFEKAVEGNEKLRYMCLVDLDEELFVKIIGEVDKNMEAYMRKLTEMTKNAKKMRVTTPAGTDISFENEPSRKIYCDLGEADKPGLTFMPGQICWFPKFDTINGTIVFDGSLTPPCGLLDEPVKITIENGVATNIEGGRQATQFSEWLKSFDDPNMYRPVHISYGVNPKAQLSGNICEDERIWGCTQWGFGYLSPVDCPPDGIPAKTHLDGICLNSSVWMDGEQIWDKGKVVNKELAEYSKKLGK